MSWTSYGTMFHSVARPVTSTVVPRSRRDASRTVANASGRISSSVSAIVRRSSPSAPPLPSAPVSSLSSRSRSVASLAPRFCSRSPAAVASSALVRSRSTARNFAVWARTSSSLTPASRVSCSWIASMMGWIRFRSRSWRVPRMAVSTLLNMQSSYRYSRCSAM